MDIIIKINRYKKLLMFLLLNMCACFCIEGGRSLNYKLSRQFSFILKFWKIFLPFVIKLYRITIRLPTADLSAVISTFPSLLLVIWPMEFLFLGMSGSCLFWFWKMLLLLLCIDALLMIYVWLYRVFSWWCFAPVQSQPSSSAWAEWWRRKRWGGNTGDR